MDECYADASADVLYNDTSKLAELWDSTPSGGNLPTFVSGAGPQGQNVIHSGFGSLVKSRPPSSSAALGAWFNPTNLDAFPAAILDGRAGQFIRINWNNLGIPKLWCYNTQLAVGDGSFNFAVGVGHFVVLRANITLSVSGGNTNISAELDYRVDGVSRLTYGPAIVQTISTTDPDYSLLTQFFGFSIILGGQNTCNVYYSNDWTRYKDNVQVAFQKPTGQGFYTAWTPNGAASGYQCVNETPPDDDTTYIDDGASIGAKESNTYSGSVTGTIWFVQQTDILRSQGAGSPTVQQFLRESGTDHNFGAAHVIGSTYFGYHGSSLTDPATGIAWAATPTEAGVDRSA